MINPGSSCVMASRSVNVAWRFRCCGEGGGAKSGGDVIGRSGCSPPLTSFDQLSWSNQEHRYDRPLRWFARLRDAIVDSSTRHPSSSRPGSARGYTVRGSKRSDEMDASTDWVMPHGQPLNDETSPDGRELDI